MVTTDNIYLAKCFLSTDKIAIFVLIVAVYFGAAVSFVNTRSHDMIWQHIATRKKDWIEIKWV